MHLSDSARKDLRGVPQHIGLKLMAWISDAETRGLEQVRRVPGYHDEPLKGDRAGQRSIRLSLSYRAIYEIREHGIEFVSVEEVTKYKY